VTDGSPFFDEVHDDTHHDHVDVDVPPIELAPAALAAVIAAGAAGCTDGAAITKADAGAMSPTGGGGGAGGGIGTPVALVDCSPRSRTLDFIDDMEDGNA